MKLAVMTSLMLLWSVPLAQTGIPPVPPLPGLANPGAVGSPPAMVNPMEGMPISADQQQAVPVEAPAPWYKDSFLADPILLIVMLVLLVIVGVGAYLYVFKDR